MKRPKLLFFVSALVFAVGAATFLAGRDGSAATPGGTTSEGPEGASSGASAERSAPPAGPEPAPKPFGTVSGSEPHTKLTLVRLRRTGPKVVSVTLSVALERSAPAQWMPELEGPRGRWYTAAGLVLVDEVNGREHFVLEDADRNCLCSTDIGHIEPGESIVVSAKFPAPPADVRYASIQVPGFASFDRVPIEP